MSTPQAAYMQLNNLQYGVKEISSVVRVCEVRSMISDAYIMTVESQNKSSIWRCLIREKCFSTDISGELMALAKQAILSTLISRESRYKSCDLGIPTLEFAFLNWNILGLSSSCGKVPGKCNLHEH